MEERPHYYRVERGEVALHPAAAEVLIDSLRDAGEHTQVLVTSHSPELLDNQAISDDSIAAVFADHGESRIGPLDEVGRSALRDRLYTVGELLKMKQIEPDPSLTPGTASARAVRPGRPYRPTLLQSSLTAILDLDAARAAPSFEKLWRDVISLLTAVGG
ncbi:MAG: hypothetical protein OXQ31_16250 [Spirochaetaceae bacterium]|nr:hypothetical protein [Spirochaetaceae bacterium]